MRRFLLSATAMLLVLLLQWPGAAAAITAPELRGAKSMQDLSSDMHGRNLQQKEFLKMDLEGTDFSDSDLRGTVFNTTQLQDSNFSGADLRDVVAFSSRFDRADLSQARLDNGMLLQSKFTDATIDGADSQMPCSIYRRSSSSVPEPLESTNVPVSPQLTAWAVARGRRW